MSRVFCVRAWVPRSGACVLLSRMPASVRLRKMLLAKRDPLFFSPFAITTTGAPHTQSFYTGVETTWGFPPTGRKGLLGYYVSRDTTPLLEYGFIMVTRRPPSPPREVA